MCEETKTYVCGCKYSYSEDEYYRTETETIYCEKHQKKIKELEEGLKKLKSEIFSQNYKVSYSRVY
jgi:septation ring formation regulator EzrA